MAILKHKCPVLEYDPDSREIIPPDRFANNKELPEKCVFAFLGDAVDTYAEAKQAEILDVIETCTGRLKIYGIREKDETMCLVRAPLGASASVQILDALIAAGCKKILAAGSCGVLTEIEENRFIVPVMALRDEGTSYRYLPPSRYIKLDIRAVEALESVLKNSGLNYRRCMTWTTDGFFRETEEMTRYRKEEGCTTVEMECAALAACAEKRGALFGQVFYTADNLSDPGNYEERGWGKDAVEDALKLCIETLHIL